LHVLGRKLTPPTPQPLRETDEQPELQILISYDPITESGLNCTIITSEGVEIECCLQCFLQNSYLSLELFFRTRSSHLRTLARQLCRYGLSTLFVVLKQQGYRLNCRRKTNLCSLNWTLILRNLLIRLIVLQQTVQSSECY